MVYSAFIFGSSKQGNARRAATGSNLEVEIALKNNTTSKLRVNHVNVHKHAGLFKLEYCAHGRSNGQE